MAKKKKKSSSKLTPEKSPQKGRNSSQNKIKAEIGGSNRPSLSGPVCSSISLAIPTQSQASLLKAPKGSLSKINHRVVYIHENDARSFSVHNGEKVLVLKTVKEASDSNSVRIAWGLSQKEQESASSVEPSVSESDSATSKYLYASICTLNVVSMQNKMTSPSSSSKSNVMFPREGQAKFSPPTLAFRMSMCGDDQAKSNDTSDVDNNDNDTSTKVITTPTPSTKPSGQFTFENFVRTPPSGKKSSKLQHTTPSNQGERSSNSNAIQVALLSFEKYKEAFNILAREGGRFTLKLASSSSSSDIYAMQKSKGIMNQIVKVLCRGQYFAKDDTIIVSFQGKKNEFVVTCIEELNVLEKDSIHVNMDGLTESLRGLTIGMSKTDHKMVGDAVDRPEVGTVLLGQMKENLPTPLLYRVGGKTTFDFIFGDGVDARNDDSLSVTTELKGKSSDLEHESSSRTSRVVAGLDDIKSQILSVLIPSLFYPERFPQSGPIRAPKGVLLYGSSGCGKSVLASQIEKDVKNYSLTQAKNANRKTVETICVNCATIQSSTSVMGEAEKILTRIFKEAEKRAIDEKVSTLILLDDVHLICPRRGAAGGGNSIERVASTLLALIDGIGKNETSYKGIRGFSQGNITILAITTNPSSLDPALRRAGRLDTEVEVPSPDDRAKCDILNMHITNLQCEGFKVPVMNEDNLMKLAKLAKGFTGADCALCVKEAVREAISRHEESKSSDVTVGIAPNSIAVELSAEDIRRAIRITKPSAIKSVTVEIPSVPWSSIGGMTDVKRQLREAIELPLTHSHLFEALDIPPPRGVLLYGPPGCSKTLMARALATEGGMNFLAVKGPELLSKWLGESERALAALFQRARLASPCVIFFDEIDAIASKRGSVESSGGERMLSQLLTELDGVTMTASATSRVKDGKKQPRVVVVGATNRPDLLDKALTRPGRIDRMIYVGLPDEETRVDILRLNLKSKSCGPDIDHFKIAQSCEGYSGAEIVSICREAALFAIDEHDQDQSERSMPFITMKHVLRSIKNTKQQITRAMLEFYDSFGKASCNLRQ